MKKLKSAIFLGLAVALCSNAFAGFGWGTKFDEGDLDIKKNSFVLHEKDETPTDLPAENAIKIYAKDDAGTTKIYKIDSLGSESELGSGGGGGGISRIVVITSGNVIAGATASTDYVYLVAGAHTVTLPTAVGNTNLYKIKNNHSANITIDTTSSQTIDGTTSISIAPEESVDLISDGTNWRIQ